MAMARTRKKEEPKKADDLTVMRERFRRGKDAVTTLYDLALEDIKFVAVPGNQWDEATKRRRKNRPCYEFPKLRGQVMQIINEQKQARPQGKVRGVGAEDRGLAEIMQGLCRNIESVSNAEQAYDIGYESAVQGGFGSWRLATDYANQDDFDLEIFVRPNRNTFAVIFDSAAIEIDRRDANWAFVVELIPKEEFERRYPDCDVTDFFTDRDYIDWHEKGQVRIAEYWEKVRETTELWALSDGRIVNSTDLAAQGVTEQTLQEEGVRIVRRRSVEGHKVYSRLTNGAQWLTDRTEFPSKFIPIVPVWGNIQNIEGEDYWCGAVRFGKDQQRLHNHHKTAAIEAVAKAPKAPYIVKASWIQGYEEFWKNANAEDYPYLPVSDVTPNDAIPKRTQQAEVPTALLELARIDNDDMKAATGIFDASLGQRSNETSGKAIGMRRAQGATATFNYIDNLVYAIKYTYEILVDMIPRVYDTQRVVRILGPDGGEKWKTLYQEVPDPDNPGQFVTLNDISKGKYDVTVTVGPSYATQRLEAVETYTELAGQLGSSLPAIAPLLAYQVLHNVDLPGSEEVDTALRELLVGQGLLPPKDGEEPPQQPAPDPRMEATMRKLMAEARKAEAAATKTEAEAQTVLPQADADIQKTIAEAVAQQLQNLVASGQLAALMQPPPIQPIPTFPEPMAPHGAISLSGDPASAALA